MRSGIWIIFELNMHISCKGNAEISFKNEKKKAKSRFIGFGPDFNSTDIGPKAQLRQYGCTHILYTVSSAHTSIMRLFTIADDKDSCSSLREYDSCIQQKREQLFRQRSNLSKQQELHNILVDFILLS
jgi:hypothetical protein